MAWLASILCPQKSISPVKFLADGIRGAYGQHAETSMIVSARQEAVVRKILAELRETKKPEAAAEEKLAFYLNRIVACMDEFDGTITSDEILNAVFAKFCVGK